MSDAPVIRFEHVTKQYASRALSHIGAKGLITRFPEFLARRNRHPVFTALKDVSFEVGRGESFAVVGLNGAGKSTSLALIAKVMRPTSGTVHTVGRICPLLELGAGFHPDLTGRENIELNGVLLGMTKRELRAKTEPILDFAGIGEFIDEPLRTYSTGMMARLGFAVAVHLDPDILLVDEILAVGDVTFRAKCLDRISEFRRRGVTFVIVAHDTQLVRANCDRAVLLYGGSVHMTGESGAVADEYLRLVTAAKTPAPVIPREAPPLATAPS